LTFWSFKRVSQKWRKAERLSFKEVPEELREAERKVIEMRKKIEEMREKGVPEEDIAPYLGELAIFEKEYLDLLQKYREQQGS